MGSARSYGWVCDGGDCRRRPVGVSQAHFVARRAMPWASVRADDPAARSGRVVLPVACGERTGRSIEFACGRRRICAFISGVVNSGRLAGDRRDAGATDGRGG